MNSFVQKSLIALSLAAAGLAAHAQATSAPAPATAASMHRVDKRMAHQEARIAQGTASGALTPHEQRRLQREQRAIAHAETHAKADGTVTPNERRKLSHMQNRASRDIHRQKHDAQKVTPVATVGATAK